MLTADRSLDSWYPPPPCSVCFVASVRQYIYINQLPTHQTCVYVGMHAHIYPTHTPLTRTPKCTSLPTCVSSPCTPKITQFLTDLLLFVSLFLLFLGCRYGILLLHLCHSQLLGQLGTKNHKQHGAHRTTHSTGLDTKNHTQHGAGHKEPHTTQGWTHRTTHNTGLDTKNHTQHGAGHIEPHTTQGWTHRTTHNTGLDTKNHTQHRAGHIEPHTTQGWTQRTTHNTGLDT